MCSFFITQAQDSVAISYHFKDKPLKNAFKELEQRFDLTFSYEDIAVSNKIIKNVKVSEVGLEEAIKEMLFSQSLIFEVIDDQYVIIKKLDEMEQPKDRLCGVLKDSLSNSPLPFGNVWIKGSTIGVSTNQNGFFELKGRFSPNDTLQLQYIGYKIQSIPLSALINKDCKQVLLSADLIAIPNIVIEDKAIELLRASSSGDGVFFRPDQMSLLPGWGDNDVLRMAQLIPGVNSVDESASNLYIRGGTPDQNMVRWDGIPIYHTGHMFGLFSAFNPASAASISIHTGGLSAKHGERIAGLIDIKSKPAQLDSLAFEVGVNLINIHSYLQIPIIKGKSALALSARRSFTDIVQSGTYQKFFNQVSANGRIQENKEVIDGLVGEVNLSYNPKFFFSDWSAKWLYDLGEESEVSVSFYEGKDRLDYSLGGTYYTYYIDSKDEIDLRNWGIRGLWKQKWNPQFLSEVSIVHSYFENGYLFRASSNPDIVYQNRIQLNNQLGETNIQLNQTWKISPLNAINFGFQYSKKRLGFDILFEEVPNPVNEENAESNAELKTFYIDYDWNVSERLAIDFGTRINFLSSFEEELWEPRLSIDYQPFDFPIHLKGSAGKFAQIVSRLLLRNELGLGEQLWFLTTQDRNLPFIDASEFTSGLWFEKNGWLIDVEYYYKRTNNLTSFILNENQNQNNAYNRGNAFAEGLDILVKKKWKNYSSWMSYSLARVDFQFSNLAFGQPFPADHDQRHIFKWTHLLNLKKWSFSANWTYKSGRPYSIPNLTQMYSQQQEQFVYNLDYAAVNQKRLPAYHRLDVSITYQIQSSKGHLSKIGLSIMNLYNRNNVFERVFQLSAPSEPTLISYDRPMLGLTPNLFISFKW